jgi:putative two-component system response regulator
MWHARVTADILVVDDDAAIRELLRHMLGDEGHRVTLAADATAARNLIQRSPFDIVLCDVKMPGESGLSFAAHLASEYPDTAVMMITALDNPELAEATVGFGAFAYIVKPFRRSEVLGAVSSALRRLDLADAGRRERDLLEHQLIEQTAELREALQRLQHQERDRRSSDAETMRRLARAIEYRSHETGDHIERVGAYCALIARRIGLDHEQTERIRTASMMHDVGKVGIADQILLKPGRLTADERREMERHAEIGHDLLQGSDGELMNLAATIAWSHHERFDGDGYPRRLRGDAIPLEGRIAAVADVFDALTQDRVYRPALPLDEALATMAAGRETQFDPDALDPFLEAPADALVIASGGTA